MPQNPPDKKAWQAQNISGLRNQQRDLSVVSETFGHQTPASFRDLLIHHLGGLLMLTRRPRGSLPVIGEVAAHCLGCAQTKESLICI